MTGESPPELPDWGRSGPRAHGALLRQAASLVASRLDALDEPPNAETTPPPTDDLYAGPLGLALFWAAAHRVLDGDGSAKDRSLGYLEPTRRRIDSWLDDPESVERDGVEIGGYRGLGAILYTFTVVGSLLDLPELLREAQEIPALLTPDRIARDRRYDPFSGASGALLALMALRDVAEEAETLEPSVAARCLDLARLCGEHLLVARRRTKSGVSAWCCDGMFQTGFPHGASGIGYALLRLYAHDPDPRWLEAAMEGFAFERSLFRPESGDWLHHPDDDPSQRRFVASWCRGAPGIALARVETLRHVDDAEIRREARIALATTMGAGHLPEDDLCCGNMGRVDILLSCVRRGEGRGVSPGAVHVRHFARALVYRTMARAKAVGDFSWTRRPDEWTWNPFLMQGAAGLGYTFLRMLNPRVVPSPLVLQSPRRM